MEDLPAWAEFYLGCGFLISLWLVIAGVVDWIQS